MVCVYCDSPTQVSNSRLQRRNNNIWRRRVCLKCATTFTTTESPELGGVFMVRASDGALRPFDRDQLFISVYESCRHRPSARADATGLTETAVSQILSRPHTSVVERRDIIEIVHRALQRF